MAEGKSDTVRQGPEFPNPGNRETPQRKGLLSAVKRVFGKPQLPQAEQQNNLTELKPALAEGPQPRVVDPSEIDQRGIENSVLAAKQTLRKPETPSGGRGAGVTVTKEEAEAANTGKYAPRGIEKAVEDTAKSRVLRGALPAVAAFGTVGTFHIAYETVPAIQRAADSVLGGETPVSPVFDPDAKSGTVEVGVNTPVAISRTELKKAYEKQVEENKGTGKPTMLFPVTFTQSGQKVDYAYDDAPKMIGKDSKTGEPVIIQSLGAIDFHFEKGQKIPVWAENAQIFRIMGSSNGITVTAGIAIKWEENGKQYIATFGNEDGRTFIYVDAIMSAPETPKGGNWRDDAKNGLALPLGATAATVNSNSTPASGINVSVRNPGTGRWESVRPNFVIDNSTGQAKLLVLLDQQ